MSERACVYCIRHIKSDSVYVGSTTNLKQRISLHRSLLKLGTHHSSRLQAAWNQHGDDAFEFCGIEFIDDPKKLAEREQYWIDELRSFGPSGFNISPYAKLGHPTAQLNIVHPIGIPLFITSEHIRAARAMLNWNVTELARRVGISPKSIQRIERRTGIPKGIDVSIMMTIQGVLEQAGVEIIPEGHGSPGGGPGMRLRSAC